MLMTLRKVGNASGYESGHDEGKKLGHEEGHQECHKLGFKEGYDVGKLVLELNPDVRPTDKARPSQSHSGSLTGGM